MKSTCFIYILFYREKMEEHCDVACIRTNIVPNFHAILHYFTLKDPFARGCVRPSCFAYISQNQTKLYHLKQDILEIFNKSAQILKHANIRWIQILNPHSKITVNFINLIKNPKNFSDIHLFNVGKLCNQFSH